MACVGWCNNIQCSNHIAACSNSFSLTAINIFDIIRSVHVDELIDAVDAAYTRLSGGSSGLTDPATGDPVASADFDDVKTHINILSQDGWASDFITLNYEKGLSTTKARSDHLQEGANDLLNLCRCDFNCTCNNNCGCNVDCTCNYSDERLKKEWRYL